jgi:RNA recognition motif-containing protein
MGLMRMENLEYGTVALFHLDRDMIRALNKKATNQTMNVFIKNLNTDITPEELEKICSDNWRSQKH